MTAPLKTATASPEPFTHPVWCQPDRCHITPGESALHRHRIGVAAGTEVTVERIDDYDHERRIRHGRPQVYVYGHGDTGMDPGQVDGLSTLLTLGAMFVGEVS